MTEIKIILTLKDIFMDEQSSIMGKFLVLSTLFFSACLFALYHQASIFAQPVYRFKYI